MKAFKNYLLILKYFYLNSKYKLRDGFKKLKNTLRKNNFFIEHREISYKSY